MYLVKVNPVMKNSNAIEISNPVLLEKSTNNSKKSSNIFYLIWLESYSITEKNDDYSEFMPLKLLEKTNAYKI